MSREPSAISGGIHAGGEAGPPPPGPDDSDQSGVRGQAAEIIDSVLAGSEPERAGVRNQLRQRLAANPGRPEVALVEHLITLRSLTGASDIGAGDGSVPEQPSSGSPLEGSDGHVKSKIEGVLRGRMLVTAFQPIYSLSDGGVVGAQALTRFFSEDGDRAADRFVEARNENLGSDLEFAALESAMEAAKELPPHLYVALKLSAATCLDPLLPGLLEDSPLALERMVLELTEAMTRDEPAALATAMAPLRRIGVRLAIDHAGSYFRSIRHIKQLRPDIIKLDRNLVAGLDTDPIRSSLGEAMVGFADHIGALVVAQGIETFSELAAVRSLGANAGQGYLLGRPTANPEDWNGWAPAASEEHSLTTPDWNTKT